MPLTCDNNNLTPEQIFAAILTQQEVSGFCALRIIKVADGGADWADCDNTNQDVDTLIKRLVGVDGNGNLGLRVIEVTEPAAGANCIECSNANAHLPLKEIAARSIIGLAADGHPALRLATL
jgi:hypothetical protein